MHCIADIEFAIDDASSSCSSVTKSLATHGRRSSGCSTELNALGFCQRDEHSVMTSDGWRLHITHVYDPTVDSSVTSRPQHPVLMIPGLASSAEHTFDLLPDFSLVSVLVSRGYDVWMADLRGNGRSQRPKMFDRSTWWTVDDHFHKDVPAVLEFVLVQTGAKQVHWIGHSMGGMLAVGLLSQQGRLASAIRSITLVASGCFGRGSWHGVLRPLINHITHYGFPAGIICQGIGAFAGGVAALWALEALFYWPSNMTVAAAKRLMSGCFGYIPVGVIKQFMGSLNTEEGLTSYDGKFRYADPQALRAVDVPVLGLNGTWDLFCPATGGRRTVQMFGSSSKQFVCLGPEYGTSKSHYGHFDIVSGKYAAEEVYPYITSWLESHDAPLQPVQAQQVQ
eukprot:GHRR01010211.1.p1 GENE.GHRR01010211.1~~GHRR01010211.1.p1  ORF type:complete len:394 (+),score=117.32 GHRR01010211.1:692-1873(+)